MSRTVAIFASGVGSAGAVSGRVGALAAGLRDRGWTVDVIDLSPPKPSRARILLDRLPPQVNDDRTPIEITSRRGDAVLLARADYEALEETAHLLPVPANARRLIESLQQARSGQREQRDLAR